MRITVEIEFDVEVYESDNGRVFVQGARFPGCKQNLHPYLSESEKIRLQAELECAVEQAAIDKAVAIRERREMAGDFRREQIRDDKMTDFTYSQWKV